jgi:hypothetical protein
MEKRRGEMEEVSIAFDRMPIPQNKRTNVQTAPNWVPLFSQMVNLE